LLVGLLRALSAFVGRLPWTWLRALSWPLAWVVACLWRVRRIHVERSMRTAGIEAPRRAARAHYGSLATSSLEVLWMAGRPEEPLSPVVEIDPASREAFERARSKGRGVVFAASHTGNWEIAAARLAEEIPFLAVTKELRVRGFDGFATKLRASRGVKMAYAGTIVERARATLNEGGAVAMVIDQVPSSRKHCVRCDFLGAQAWVGRGPAAVAARCGAPLVVTAARRNDDGTHTLEVLGVHEPPPRAGRAWIDQVTIEATRALDRFVRANPSEWLWLHRRWAMPAA
jgi:KDO2-lipid IV(A) lauroyltransferase